MNLNWIRNLKLILFFFFLNRLLLKEGNIRRRETISTKEMGKLVIITAIAALLHLTTAAPRPTYHQDHSIKSSLVQTENPDINSVSSTLSADQVSTDSSELLPLTATIQNGTLAHIQRRGSDFLYCSISDASVENLHDYKIVWVDPKGKRVGSYRCGNVRRRRCSQFTIDTDGVPYSYLTLVDFRRAFQGKYTCELWHRRDRVGSAQVLVQMGNWFQNINRKILLSYRIWIKYYTFNCDSKLPKLFLFCYKRWC